MTVHAVLVDPPRPGLVLPDLTDDLLSDAEAADLYAAMARDAIAAAAASGGDLLVNYRPTDLLPEEYEGVDAEAGVRALAADALPDLDDVRFEVQVGSTHAARVGNTVTHLLRDEDAASVAAVDPRAPLLDHTTLDSAAMKLRRRDVVLGPSQRGRVHYAGFADTLDFADADHPPEVDTLAARAADAGLDTDFAPASPVVTDEAGLADLLPLLSARERAGRRVPTHTAAAVDDLGLHVTDDRTVTRHSD